MMMNKVIFVLCLILVATTATQVTNKKKLHDRYIDNSFEANWMGQLSPVLQNVSILDLSLPGTHDTMTYDLSTTVSDNANDLTPELAWILHELGPILNIAQIGAFIRTLSVTQGLTITQQLDSGVRFLDFRLTYSAGPNKPSNATYDWYSLHFMQSNRKAIDYLTEVKAWLLDHPTEIIVLWLSHHGCNGCSDTYQVSADVQRKFWAQLTQLYSGMLYNFTRGTLKNTTLREMLRRNERVVVYAGEYDNMTNGSDLAISDALIDNEFTGSQAHPAKGVQKAMDCFRQSNDHIAQNVAKNGNTFYLVSMAGGVGDDQMKYAAMLTYFPWLINVTATQAECAAMFHTPNMTQYCPMTLQEQALMKNYYDQIAFEYAAQNRYGFPNGIYLGGMDINGTFRVGPDYFAPDLAPPNPLRPHGDAKYSYTGTLALANVYRVCPVNTNSTACKNAVSLVQSRRALFPLNRWQDDYYGRQSVWPMNSSSALSL